MTVASIIRFMGLIIARKLRYAIGRIVTIDHERRWLIFR